MENSSNFRCCNITTFTEFMTQEQLLNAIHENFVVKHIVIGATEVTEDEKEHFHTYINFGKSTRFTTVKKVLPSSHIEKCYSDVFANWNYATKEGDPYYSNFDILDLVNKDKKKESLESSLINDIFVNHLNLYQIIQKYPHYAIFHFDNIKKIVEVRNSHDKDLLLLNSKSKITGELTELVEDNNVKIEIIENSEKTITDKVLDRIKEKDPSEWSDDEFNYYLESNLKEV